jgi:hypothetical protein
MQVALERNRLKKPMSVHGWDCFKNVSLIVSPNPYRDNITIVIFEVKKMKPWKAALVAGVALITVAFLTASALAYMGGRGTYGTYGTATGNTNSFGNFFNGMMGGRMMGRGYPYGTGTTTQPYAGQYAGIGCRAWNNYGTPNGQTQGTAITIDQAVTIANNYLASRNNPDLAIDEVEEYSQNFYVLFYEKSTGLGAYEMIINKYTGQISPEMGPNMMWNTKYGPRSSRMMGWMMGGQTGPLTVTDNQSKTYAQQFLDSQYPGTTVGNVDTFYGYYHVDVLQAGKTYGMLSVNGYTGQVWYHNWRGTFVQAVELQ